MKPYDPLLKRVLKHAQSVAMQVIGASACLWASLQVVGSQRIEACNDDGES